MLSKRFVNRPTSILHGSLPPLGEMGLIYEPLNQNFLAAILVPLLDAGEVRVGAVTARQVLLVEGRVLADQVAVGLVDVGERPQLAGLPLAARPRASRALSASRASSSPVFDRFIIQGGTAVEILDQKRTGRLWSGLWALWYGKTSASPMPVSWLTNTASSRLLLDN